MVKSNHSRVLSVLAVALVAAVTALHASTASAQGASDILEQPPFEPTDVSLFGPSVYSDAPPMEPASSGPTDETTLRGLLRDLLNDRFPDNPKTVKQALKTFDSQSTKAIVPDPRLRAALVALKGTAGEPAIAGTLDGTYSTVRFGTDVVGDPVAQMLRPSESPDGTRQVVFNQKYQFEDFKLLTASMAHEALHRDDLTTDKEELTANSIDALVYGQFVLESPELATSGTELARNHNTKLMARINTRDANGNLRLFTSQGNIFPGGNFVPYFAAPFEPLGDSTPGNSILKGELKKVLGKVPRKVNFDDKTVLLLDKKQKVFTPAEVVQLAEILKLDTSASATQRAQEAEAEAPDRPTPNWQEIFGAE